ncbi:GTPase HflX [Limosilactobacillus sp.]|jgi:GTP-binding protein HflX|uniref:GTPase HflX n=1 Tax=Limosilactobacillus sp. TaxID=2773925 RepID=UPI0025BD927E|nr:GTPase HflX [Limosilactobacillus sp.]MCH3921385.1 GTPase HflX [Limosilactobacillus sp.]MCH3928156.1 GTPase HflX [Limosilactobacillus sp.]
MDTNIQADERVIITGLDTGQEDFDYSMTELAELAQANHMDVVERIDQVVDRPNPATYFGKGKVQEIADVASANHADTIITNDELTPSQLRNLEEETGHRILDRTALILEIFATRAKTKEAKLQVQIAELQYRLPRLQTSASQRLDQQTGGGSGFTNRGAGETKLEMDRRVIQHQITHLRHELAAIDKSEETKRKQRAKSEIPTAALVGYTNAGKSTLMNGLVRKYGKVEDKTVFEKNMLFATLDTSVRRMTLPGKKEFLLSDTVGFVSKLPTQLIESFKSTLAEAANADLLIQVIDYSDPHYEEMMETTKKTLHQIGIHDIPMIYVFNKADKTENETEYPVLEGDDQLVISAKQDASLDLLVDVIRKHLFQDYVQAKLLIPFADGQVVSYLNEHSNILDTEYQSNGTLLTMEAAPQDYQRFARYEVK